jgi:hypothetical protein
VVTTERQNECDSGASRQTGPGFGEALGADIELPVGIHERNECDRHAQHSTGEPGQPVESFLVRHVEQPCPAHRGKSLLIIYHGMQQQRTVCHCPPSHMSRIYEEAA